MSGTPPVGVQCSSSLLIGWAVGKKIHPHTVRHCFAMNWMRQNRDLRRLQLLLDHSIPAVTREYLQFRDASIMDTYDS